MTMTKESAEEALNTIIANPAGVIATMGWDEQQFAMHLTVFSAVAGMSVENMVAVHRVIFDQLGYTGLDDENFVLKLRDNIRRKFHSKEVEHV
ncbi:hypothetical protein ESZ50_08995 [Weissella muntiaci]|uniref:Uncharacterized protein n=1 Tax=Weissella muntiaci TaxID=2508881 RepID=A0A6C2C320_9LACO|nr:hypothetical protein [Weissella muntiaci]TYC48370.1 hypothetical protein ESZ50_08995 [Weissella muntiaci]